MREAHEAHHEPISRLRREAAPPRIGLNLTAMIDVVFLLLIYFMVATEFKLGEEVYQLDLPERAYQPDPFELDEEPLRITITSLGFARDAAVIDLPDPYDDPAGFDGLHEFLRTRQINEATRGGLFQPDHPIMIHPSAETNWEHVMEAYNAAARARYTNVNFAPPG